jgi:hypothetical protein
MIELIQTLGSRDTSVGYIAILSSTLIIFWVDEILASANQRNWDEAGTKKMAMVSQRVELCQVEILARSKRRLT